MRIPVTYFASATETSAIPLIVTWDELAALLAAYTAHVCDKPGSDCTVKQFQTPAWSPAAYPVGSKRGAKAVTALTALVLDCDHLTHAALLSLAERLEASGWRYLVHSTHSHRPPEDNALRLVLPLSRPLERGDRTLPAFSADVNRIRAYAEDCLGLPRVLPSDGMGGSDGTTKDPCRLFYLPSGPAPEGFLFERQDEGGAVDLDVALGRPPSAIREPSTAEGQPHDDAPEPPSYAGPAVATDPGPDLGAGEIGGEAGGPGNGDPDRGNGGDADGAPGPALTALSPGDEAPPVDLDAAWARLYRIRKRDSLVLIKTMKRGEPLALPGARDHTVNRAASIIAGAIPELPVEAVLAMMRPSLAAMPATEGEDLDHWLEKARYSFERARDRRLAELERARAWNTQVLAKIAPGPSQALLDGVPEDGTDEDLAADDWRRGLILKPFDPDSNAKRKLAKDPANAGLILQHSEEWAGKLRWNALRKTVELLPGSPLHGYDPGPNVLPTEVANWLARSDWELSLSSLAVKEQIAHVARRNAYEPVQDYLRSVQWDGTPRLDGMLRTYFKARTVRGETDIGAYVDAVSAKWAISAAARALRPGCQVDTVLILESEQQGFFKTSALRVLGGGWYRRTSAEMRDKDAQMIAGTAWIIELGELETLSRADVTLAKAFFTDTVDSFRPPYGAAVEDWPRRCVWVGTTNETDYLQDRENRRYWPIEVTAKIDIDGLRRDRDQLWAEAVARFYAADTCAECLAIAPKRCAAHAWWFTETEKATEALAAGETAARRASDMWADFILDWWQRLAPATRPERVTPSMIAAQDCLNLPKGQVNRAAATRIGMAMAALGFEKAREWAGQRSYFYRPTPELLKLPHRTRTLAETARQIAHTPARN